MELLRLLMSRGTENVQSACYIFSENISSVFLAPRKSVRSIQNNGSVASVALRSADA